MTATDLAMAATTHRRESSSPSFALRGAHGSLVCAAERCRLSPGCANTLATRVADFFADEPDGPGMLVGALPFDRNAADHLFQPAQIQWLDTSAAKLATAPMPCDYHWRLISAGAPTRYANAVSQALRMLDTDATNQDALRKVVLARHIELEADRPIDIEHVAQLLAADHHATVFSVRLPGDDNSAMADHGGRHLVGASPELLIAKTGVKVHSYPLAGSAKRHSDRAKDEAAARALAASDKEQREHAAVVEAILDTLAPYCTQLSAARAPLLRSTRNLWHLGTPIDGVLKNPTTSSAELAAALHPTPAVCGLPRRQAQSVIQELESFDRGFYAGATGWNNAAGDGEWHVAIRCAEIAAKRVFLYAGAGIVAGSVPAAETRETAVKFAVMLKALGVDEQQLQGVLEAMT